MTATERLRELLDERGVGSYTHEAPAAVCLAFFDGKRWHDCWESTGGEVNVTFSMTPAQAIAATLGPTATTVDETETWECVCDQIGRYGKRVTVHMMECSECGHTYEHVNGDYEFCPHCGRRVVEVDA